LLLLEFSNTLFHSCGFCLKLLQVFFKLGNDLLFTDEVPMAEWPKVRPVMNATSSVTATAATVTTAMMHAAPAPVTMMSPFSTMTHSGLSPVTMVFVTTFSLVIHLIPSYVIDSVLNFSFFWPFLQVHMG
jgi:hypothetical protein